MHCLAYLFASLRADRRLRRTAALHRYLHTERRIGPWVAQAACSYISNFFTEPSSLSAASYGACVLLVLAAKLAGLSCGKNLGLDMESLPIRSEVCGPLGCWRAHYYEWLGGESKSVISSVVRCSLSCAIGMMPLGSFAPAW
jgi:hypothetical protein